MAMVKKLPRVRRSKPKLTIDVGPLLETQWTGIPVFTRRVVQSMLQRDDVALDFCWNLARIDSKAVEAALRVNSGALLRDWYERQSGNGLELVDKSGPIFYPSVKRFHGLVAREASTVHDISTLVMPENHEAANVDYHLEHFADQLSSSETVFCVSSATEAALHANFPSTKSKTRLIYQYADWPEEFEETEKNLAPPVFGPYVVVIGTIEPRKNLELILKALAEPAIRDSAVKFVIVGKKGWKVDIFLAELPPESRERLLFTGFVTEFTKYRLLRHCEFMIFPSLYEGFGIPALEAMSLGKPVLAAMTTSFPEVIGDGGIYFDAYSATEFALAFQEMSNADRRLELSIKAVAHAATFNAKRLSDSLVCWLAEQR